MQLLKPAYGAGRGCSFGQQQQQALAHLLLLLVLKLVPRGCVDAVEMLQWRQLGSFCSFCWSMR
jgi:hypothetical protein